MNRFFLDANVLFSAAYRDDAGVQELWRVGRAELITSDYAVDEALRNLREPHQKTRLAGLLESVEVAPAAIPAPGQRGGVRLPDKDWPILGGAVRAGATHLITGDIRDFGIYFGKRILGVMILTPSQYLRLQP